MMQCKNKRASTKETHGDHEICGNLLQRRSRGVTELLATTAGTSSSNSLPESVRLLESQLQVERHRSDVLRQEVEGLRKSLQNSDPYFLVQQQALEDLSAKQEKVNKLAKHLASIMGTQDIVS